MLDIIYDIYFIIKNKQRKYKNKIYAKLKIKIKNIFYFTVFRLISQ